MQFLVFESTGDGGWKGGVNRNENDSVLFPSND